MELLLTASMKNNSVYNDRIKEACFIVSSAYGLENDTLASEIDVFSRKKHDSDQIDRHLVPNLVSQFKSENVHNQYVFPNLFKLLQLFLTIPVSTATAERSFSVLKRIKNYLRNSVLQKRLSDLAILEKDAAKNIELEECVEIYPRRKSRHLALF